MGLNRLYIRRTTWKSEYAKLGIVSKESWDGDFIDLLSSLVSYRRKNNVELGQICKKIKEE
jgi:hypothetical protein